MLFSKTSFYEYTINVRDMCKTLWNKTSNNNSLSEFNSFIPDQVLYSRINKKKIYPQLGYYANDFDCIGREGKPSVISSHKPKHFSHICYLIKEGFPRYIFMNEDGKDLLGSVVSVLDEHSYFDFDTDSGKILNIVFYEECAGALTRFSVSNNGEMVEAIINSKDEKKYYYLQCTIFADSLEEVEINSAHQMRTINNIFKRVRKLSDIKESIKNANLFFFK